MLIMRNQTSRCWFLCFSSRLTIYLLKNNRTPQQLCYLILNMPVHYQSSSIIAIIVSQVQSCSYYALKGHPASSQRGIILDESTQIRWFLRQSDGGGWSTRAIAQLRPRVSKLGFKDCPTTTPMRLSWGNQTGGQWAE
jgi:hypothetical protein